MVSVAYVAIKDLWNSEILCNISLYIVCLNSRRLRDVGTPLVLCGGWLFVIFAANFHILSFHHPQIEEAPCHGDKYPFFTVKTQYSMYRYYLHTHQLRMAGLDEWCIGSNVKGSGRGLIWITLRKCTWKKVMKNGFSADMWTGDFPNTKPEGYPLITKYVPRRLDEVIWACCAYVAQNRTQELNSTKQE